MASWGSPRGRVYRDPSPASPLTPLSPSSLPEWLRHSHTRSSFLSKSTLRILLMATGCLILGWMFTSALGPSNHDSTQRAASPYDAASAGVLQDPSGFGLPPEVKKKRPGIIGDEEEDDTASIGIGKAEASVSGALAELHHAVSHKIQSWNPYFTKGPHRGSNHTTNLKKNKNVTASFLGGEAIKDGIDEEDRLGARTRIGKVTLLFHGNMFWERCVHTHERHDREQGYRLHVLRQELIDDVWSKPAYILSNLLRELSKPESERLDWLFWCDSDTVVLNPHIPIETFLPPPGTEFDDIYLMYSNDWNGLNNGVFPIRVNQWAADMFAAIVSYRYWRPDDPLTFRDQSAMNAIMQEPKFAKHIVQAPQRWFNAYQGEHNETLQPFQVRRGDLLVHFAGVPDREARMQYWLERAEQHLDDWEVPLKSTSYIQEAKDFWNDQREIRKNQKQHLENAKEKAQKLLSTTEQHLNEYGDRLRDDQKAIIVKQREELKKLVEEGDKYKISQTKIEEGTKRLSEAAMPLTSTITDANKLLLKAAHEAIFAGEKDLLEHGFNTGTSFPELERISSAVKSLRNLVMSPEEFWNRQDITAATNAVTEARARLQEKFALELAHTNALEEAKKAAQQEADQAMGVYVEPAADESAEPPSGALEDIIPAPVVTVLGPTVWETTTIPAMIVPEATPIDDS